MGLSGSWRRSAQPASHPARCGKRQGGPLASCARGRRHTRKGGRRRMVVPAQRGVNRRPVSLLGSANLFRPRPCLNGPSNIASRHRPEATTVTRAWTPRKSQVTTIRLQVAKRASLEGSFVTRCSSGKRRVPARRGWRVRRFARLRLCGPPLKNDENVGDAAGTWCRPRLGAVGGRVKTPAQLDATRNREEEEQAQNIGGRSRRLVKPASWPRNPILRRRG
jgi:hypothetical protein